MMSNLSTLNRKWILGAVLMIWVAILTPLGIVKGVEGTPLSTAEIITYDQEDFFIMKFTALISFDFTWKYDETFDYYCMPDKYLPDYKEKFVISSPDFTYGTPDYNMIIKKENLGMFYEAGTCEISETYTAGQTYEVYLLNYNYNSPLTPETATIEKMKSQLRKRQTEPDIDENSIFTLRQEYNETLYFSRDFYLTFQPEIDITYPLDESEITETFEMEIDYWRAESFDRLMIIFEDWDIGSSCPLKSDPNYQAEKDVYFNNESLPYFSSFLATSSGTTTIEIDNLEIGNYNCNRCHFITTTGLISENLCRGYRLDVLTYIPPVDVPTFYLPISEWHNYYSEHSERYPTSTPIFTSMAETFTPLITWVGNTILFFNNYFDPETAGNRGEEIGNAVRVARGYLESIDDFFGGLPISTIFIFYLITAIVVIVYRLVKGILTIIIP